MPALLLAFALLLSGCTRTTVDAWTPTRAACGLADDETADWLGHFRLDDTDPTVAHTYGYDEDCVRALLGDVGADPGELLDEVGYDGSLAEHIEDGRAVGDHDGLHTLVSGLWWLLASDYGQVADIAPSPWIGPAYAESTLEAAAELGLGPGAPASQVLYDYVVNRVSTVEIADLGAADMEMAPGDVLRVSRSPASGEFEPSAAVLVHEARHADGYVHRWCPPDYAVPGRGCDDDTSGANGFEVATLTLNIRAMPTGTVDGCDPEVDGYVRARDHALGNRLFQWEAFILEPVPAPEIRECYPSAHGPAGRDPHGW
jgi:hypothetical protein